MPPSLPKRFYKLVSISEAVDGFEVHLDGKSIKTPERRLLCLPSGKLAEAVASEWRAQGDFIDIPQMPLTRLCHVALDLTPQNRSDMETECVSFAGTDTCCYRVKEPAPLADMQAKRLDPVLGWVAQSYGLKLIHAQTILPIEQPVMSLKVARNIVEGMDDFVLTGFVFGCGLFGSFVLSLALLDGYADLSTIFDLSRIEEDWQIKHWGADAESTELTGRLHADATALKQYFLALR